MSKNNKLIMTIGSVPPTSKAVKVVIKAITPNETLRKEAINKLEMSSRLSHKSAIESANIFNQELEPIKVYSIKKLDDIFEKQIKCICYKNSKKKPCLMHKNPY